MGMGEALERGEKERGAERERKVSTAETSTVRGSQKEESVK